MKKISILFIISVSVLLFVGCNSNNANNSVDNAIITDNNIQENKSEVFAFIMKIDEEKIVLDIAEYITSEDIERISELEVKEADMPNGYYIYNPDKNTQEYILTEDTVYNFIDWVRDFVNEDAAEDLNISTKDKEVFLKYIQPYIDAGSKVPFFFEFEENNVISITEKAITSI